MSFRQFPATGNDGNAYIILEFHDEHGGPDGKPSLRYELADGHHHDHLVCLDCGRVEEFFDAEIEKLQHNIARLKGYQLADHALSLYAHCNKPGCEGKKAGKKEAR